MEQARTHDPYWNAAQLEMVHAGTMHGYMRMYWGKKILEWTADPQEGFDIALYLNNKYQLDGRDPNGFAGVAWCFGKHDRAWGERPVFGKVRYMNANGLRRKFRIDAYVEKVERFGAVRAECPDAVEQDAQLHVVAAEEQVDGPLQGHAQSAAPARHLHQVDGAPEEPGGEAGQLEGTDAAPRRCGSPGRPATRGP